MELQLKNAIECLSVAATSHATSDKCVKPCIENRQFISGSHAATSGDKLRDFDLPLPLVKFTHRFATRRTLDCCGWSSLELTEAWT